VSWHKPGQNEAGDPGRFTSSVETFIVANYYGGQSKDNVQKAMSKNPLERHNLFDLRNLTVRLLHTDRTTVNAHQKPYGVIQWFLSRFVKPEDTIVVVGCGAGGDVLGAALSGHNVVAMERDEKQFLFMKGYLTTYKIPEIKDGKEEEKGAGVRVVCAVCGFTKETCTNKCEVCDKLVCVDCCVTQFGFLVCAADECVPNGAEWKAKGLREITQEEFAAETKEVEALEDANKKNSA
jgi:hypothetical protein